MKLNDWTAFKRGRALQLARHRKVSPTTVSDWATGKKKIPLDHVVPIERFTAREVTCEEMRPDKAADFAYLRGSDFACDHLPLGLETAEAEAQHANA